MTTSNIQFTSVGVPLNPARRVAADLTKEQQTNQAYYVVRVTLSEAELKRLGGLKLLPGMPANVYIRTMERTALSSSSPSAIRCPKRS